MLENILVNSRILSSNDIKNINETIKPENKIPYLIAILYDSLSVEERKCFREYGYNLGKAIDGLT